MLRDALDVAYALIVDGADDDHFRWFDDFLDEPVPDPVPVIGGVRWDPDTWGTTPEAQANLANALAFAGPPADADLN